MRARWFLAGMAASPVLFVAVLAWLDSRDDAQSLRGESGALAA